MTNPQLPSPHLLILDPGLSSTIQDAGRPGYTHLAIPPSGAADLLSFRAANIILGNAPNTPAIESTLRGVACSTTAPIRFTITGARSPITLTNTQGTTSPRSMWQPHTLLPGETLRIGHTSWGIYTYLSIQGGFALPLTLSSASTLPSAHLGGHHPTGRVLLQGDTLPFYINSTPLSLPAPPPPHPLSSDSLLAIHAALRAPFIRILPSSHTSLFSPQALDLLESHEFEVLPQMSRVGIMIAPRPRAFLPAPPTPLNPAPAPSTGRLQSEGRLRSEGMFQGAIQIPGPFSPDALPQSRGIILGPDHPTTGGYPLIASIIAADLPRTAQLRPGDTFRFKTTTHEHALQALQQQLALLSPYPPLATQA